MAKRKAVHCPYCGERIHPDAKRCPHCGEKIKKFSFLKFIRNLIVFAIAVFIGLVILAIAFNRYNDYKYRKRMEEREATRQTETIVNTATPTPTTAPVVSYEIEDVQEVEAEEVAEERSGISPEFKAAMDSYEAFYDEYCETMAKVGEGDATALLSYASMLSKATEMDEKFNKYNEDDLTTEEMQYYIEVNARIQQKLIAVGAE